MNSGGRRLLVLEQLVARHLVLVHLGKLEHEVDHLVRALGERASQRYFLTAERFDATMAKSLGFVHECVAPDLLDQQVQTIVAALVANGPAAVKACKRLVQDLAGQSITPALRADTAKRIADIRASAEGKEGVQSFLQKRPPSWSPT